MPKYKDRMARLEITFFILHSSFFILHLIPFRFSLGFLLEVFDSMQTGPNVTVGQEVDPSKSRIDVVKGEFN